MSHCLERCDNFMFALHHKYSLTIAVVKLIMLFIVILYVPYNISALAVYVVIVISYRVIMVLDSWASPLRAIMCT